MEVAQSVRTPGHKRRVEIKRGRDKDNSFEVVSERDRCLGASVHGGVKGAEKGIKPFIDLVLRSQKKVCVRRTQR